MTHMQSIAYGFFEGVGLAVALSLVAGCVLLFIWFGRPRDDDDDFPPNAPGLLVEALERFPFGFHRPQGVPA